MLQAAHRLEEDMGTDRETTDEEQVAEFLGRFVNHLGVTISAGNVLIGDKLGLYQTLAEAGPLTPSELTGYTSTAERYVREWQPGQAAGGYLFTSCERFFRTGYAANLVTSWIPALEGVRAKLEAGAQVADVGCGHGASTLIMAHAYPNSSFVGFDDHQPSVRHAQQVAANAGLAERCRFEVATASAYPGASYDLVTIFDALHDRVAQTPFNLVYEARPDHGRTAPRAYGGVRQ
jgi:hypothetical protein